MSYPVYFWFQTCKSSKNSDFAQLSCPVYWLWQYLDMDGREWEFIEWQNKFALVDSKKVNGRVVYWYKMNVQSVLTIKVDYISVNYGRSTWLTAILINVS